MGQYYRPTIVGKNRTTVLKWMRSHEYNNGLKLMEHSWIGNDFVAAFETLIFMNPQNVVWSGDYAENSKRRKSNLYRRCKESLKVNPIEQLENLDSTRFILNHTKKMYVDKTLVPKITARWVGDSDYRIHPLPLLTCEGNGQGGGDFFGKDPFKLVGSWAYDEISVQAERPKDFKELLFNLIEE